jgi:hypothetical protein
MLTRTTDPYKFLAHVLEFSIQNNR